MIKSHFPPPCNFVSRFLSPCTLVIGWRFPPPCNSVSRVPSSAVNTASQMTSRREVLRPLQWPIRKPPSSSSSPILLLMLLLPPSIPPSLHLSPLLLVLILSSPPPPPTPCSERVSGVVSVCVALRGPRGSSSRSLSWWGRDWSEVIQFATKLKIKLKMASITRILDPGR